MEENNTEKNKKVPFDPGYFDFAVKIPDNAMLYLDQIASLKKSHQKKFEFQKFEMQITPAIKDSVAIYLGCILWGSYVAYRYKDNPQELSGNTIKDLSEEEKDQFDITKDINFLIDLINRINRDCKYYCHKSSKVDKQLITYLETYKEFCELNDNFKTLEHTNEIKLPNIVSHFADYDNEKLDELKNKIKEILASKKVATILELGFYD